MNNLGKISVVLIAIFVAGNSMYPLSQLVHAQLDILEAPTNPNNTSASPQNPTPSPASTPAKSVDTQKSAKVKEALANIFEIYQSLAEKGDVDSLLKLNTIERILLELMR